MEPITITFLVLAIVGWAAAIALAVFFLVNKSKEKAASRSADEILRDAKIKAEHMTKNAEIDAKQIAFEAKQKADN